MGQEYRSSYSFAYFFKKKDGDIKTEKRNTEHSSEKGLLCLLYSINNSIARAPSSCRGGHLCFLSLCPPQGASLRLAFSRAPLTVPLQFSVRPDERRTYISFALGKKI